MQAEVFRNSYFYTGDCRWSCSTEQKFQYNRRDRHCSFSHWFCCLDVFEAFAIACGFEFLLRESLDVANGFALVEHHHDTSRYKKYVLIVVRIVIHVTRASQADSKTIIYIFFDLYYDSEFFFFLWKY